MKNHLKRIASPRTWVINRKRKFIVKPNPGAHALNSGLPLGIILRDFLKVASTMREVRKIIYNNDVLVDGKRRRDHRFIIGLFDVLSFPELNQHYRLVLDSKGRITVIEIPAAESKMKLCKIVGKKILSQGKLQLNLHDGKNILSKEQKIKIGDSLMLNLPDLEVKEIIPLQLGNFVFLTRGKYSGSTGELKEIRKNEVIYSQDGKNVETLRNYLFVIGSKKPALKIIPENTIKTENK